MILASFIFATACGEVSVTEVIPLETDTYISSADLANHADLPYLHISKSGSIEERVIAKLPSEKDRDINKVLEDIFEAWFYLPIEVLARIMGCTTNVVSPNNLTSATVFFDIEANGEPMTGKLTLQLLGQPWWQSANWEKAHPFSTKKGIWKTPGGFVDSSYSFPANTLNGTTIGFNITDYFKALMNSNGGMPHYGFLIQSLNASLAEASLYSTQSGSRPRVEAVYTADCGMQGTGVYRSTFELGSTAPARTERIE